MDPSHACGVLFARTQARRLHGIIKGWTRRSRWPGPEQAIRSMYAVFRKVLPVETLFPKKLLEHYPRRSTIRVLELPLLSIRSASIGFHQLNPNFDIGPRAVSR